MGEMPCPNCGQQLAPYRTEQQHAGEHEVVLCWVICPGCRHVALQSWMFADGDTEVERRRQKSQDAEQRPERSRRQDAANRVVLRSFARGRQPG